MQNEIVFCVDLYHLDDWRGKSLKKGYQNRQKRYIAFQGSPSTGLVIAVKGDLLLLTHW